MRIVSIVFFLCVFVLTRSDSQIAIGDKLLRTGEAPLEEEILSEFKSTTTVFVLRKGDDLNFFEEQLKKVWTITPLEVIKFEDIKKYLGKAEYSIFEIQGNSVSFTNSKGKDFSCSYVYLNLYLNKVGKDGELYQYSVAKMELHPEIGTVLQLGGKETTFSEDIYNEDRIYNWNEVTVLNFVKLVDDHFRKKKGLAFYEKYYTDKQLKRLKRKTLYVPEYVLRKFNPVHRTEDEVHNAEDLFSGYSYKYKVVSNQELLELYLNSEKSFYYLYTVKSCNKVLINIINGKTGEVIYSDYPDLFSYNLKSKKLKQLIKRIDKIK